MYPFLHSEMGEETLFPSVAFFKIRLIFIKCLGELTTTNKKNRVHFTQQMFMKYNEWCGVTEQFAKLYFVSTNRNFLQHIQFSLSN